MRACWRSNPEPGPSGAGGAVASGSKAGEAIRGIRSVAASTVSAIWQERSRCSARYVMQSTRHHEGAPPRNCLDALPLWNFVCPSSREPSRGAETTSGPNSAAARRAASVLIVSQNIERNGQKRVWKARGPLLICWRFLSPEQRERELRSQIRRDNLCWIGSLSRPAPRMMFPAASSRCRSHFASQFGPIDGLDGLRPRPASRSAQSPRTTEVPCR
jgi:hypothetical protein